MTITPQQAQELLEGTTPGPWIKTQEGLSHPVGYVIDRVLYDSSDYQGAVDDPNADLVCAAPDMAEQIAGMRPEYRAEFQTAAGQWFPTPHRCSCSSGWGTKQQAARHAADWKADGYAARIVRRLVSKPEEIS